MYAGTGSSGACSALPAASRPEASPARPVVRATAPHMHIGYLIQDFHPEVGAGPARALEMSRRWQEHGASVTVLTGMPNRRLPGRGDGAIDQRYRGHAFVRESVDGITVLRSWLFATDRRGFALTVLNHATFAASAFLHALARRPPINVLIASSPPFLPLLSGVAVARMLDAPLVVELRDLWPDYLEQMGVLRSRLTLGPLYGLELFLLRAAALNVVVSESFRSRVVKKGVSSHRVHVIPNGVDLGEYQAAVDSPPIDALRQTAGTFTVGYLGTFGRGQALATVVEAAAIVARSDPTIRFVLAGAGPDEPAVAASVLATRAANVAVSPPITRDQTRAFYNSCDACLVPLAPIPVFQETVPSKIFEIMACERPVIASVAGEAAAILQQSGAGTCVPPGDAEALAAAVLDMREMSPTERRALGARGRDYVARHYDRRVLADRYYELLQDVCTPDSGWDAQ